MSDEEYIDIAINISKKSKFPYGAIIVKDDKIIGRSDDDTLTSKTIYTHAELYAIESASKNKNLYGDLTDCTIYTSCEPCMMCMGAIIYEGITKLVYAATIEDSDKYYSPENIVKVDDLVNLSNSNITIVKEVHRNIAIEVLKNAN